MSRPLSGRQTNQRAEIRAAIEAIKIAVRRGYDSLAIRTDSKYLLDGATDWINNWQRNGWRNISGRPVANQSDWKMLLEVEDQIRVSYEHVFSHRGIKGNEKADSLAYQGAIQARDQGYDYYSDEDYY